MVRVRFVRVSTNHLLTILQSTIDDLNRYPAVELLMGASLRLYLPSIQLNAEVQVSAFSGG
jgi:hypothetical protein